MLYYKYKYELWQSRSKTVKSRLRLNVRVLEDLLWYRIRKFVILYRILLLFELKWKWIFFSSGSRKIKRQRIISVMWKEERVNNSTEYWSDREKSKLTKLWCMLKVLQLRAKATRKREWESRNSCRRLLVSRALFWFFSRC